MSITLTLDVWDPTGSNDPECTVVDADTGAPITNATVTATTRRDDGTDPGAALGAPLAAPVPLPHIANGVYRVTVPPADSASAGIVLGATKRLLIDYRVTLSPTNIRPIRDIVVVARRRAAA